MGIIHGRNTKLFCNGVDLTSFFKEVQLSLSASGVDASVFGVGYKKNEAGYEFGGSFSANGLWTGTAGEAQAVLAAVFKARTIAYWTYLLNGDTAGEPGFGLPILEKSHPITSILTDLVRMSFDGEISGDALIGISLGAVAQRTNASQTAAGVDLGAGYAGTFAGALIQCTVAAAGGDSSVVVTVETADDAGFTTNLGTIASATVTTLGAYHVPEAAMTVRRYVRLKAACAAGETVTVHGLLHAR